MSSQSITTGLGIATATLRDQIEGCTNKSCTEGVPCSSCTQSEAAIDIFDKLSRREALRKLSEIGREIECRNKVPAVILSGNPIDGMTIWGPFGDSDAAIGWINCNGRTDMKSEAWWIVNLESPTEKGEEDVVT